MTIERLNKEYWFHDGEIKSFRLDIPNDCIEIALNIKRVERVTPQGEVQQEELTPCILILRFEQLIELSLSNKLPTKGYFINFSTCDNGIDGIEVSLNVHDNFSSVYDKPNWVLKAKRVNWKEV